MTEIDLNNIDWTKVRAYFKEIGILKTYDIAMDEEHPLCIEANDYFNEKNE